ncbi:hypothetical protein JCM11251_000598 [Rhodosporidiobolus azoricus]
MLVLVIGDLHIPTRAHDLPAKFKKLLVPGKITQILSTGNTTDRETWDYLRSVAPDLRGVRGDWDEPSARLPPSMVVQHGPLKLGVISGHQIVPLGDAEILAATARKMDVDVLISGGTHRFEAFESDGRFFLNPGSATGAFSPYFGPASTSSTSNPSTSQRPAPSTTNGDAQGDKDEGKKDGDKAEGEGGEEAEPRRSSDKLDEEDEGEEEGPTPSFALLDIQGNVVVTYVYTEKNGDVQVEKMEFRKNPQP